MIQLLVKNLYLHGILQESILYKRVLLANLFHTTAMAQVNFETFVLDILPIL